LGFKFFEIFSIEILNFYLSAHDFALYFIFFEGFTGGNEHKTSKLGIFEGLGGVFGLKSVFLKFSDFQKLTKIDGVFLQIRKFFLTMGLSSVFRQRSHLRG